MDIKKRDNTSGLLSLEASIAVTIFIFLMLFLYSFFVVFEARNAIGHALLTTSDSLALDPFASGAAQGDLLQELLYGLYGAITNDDFSETDTWYEDASKVQETVRTRFIAYFAGGDRDEADKLLKKLNVVNGIDGLDFSESKVSSNNLFLVVKYKLDYEFKVFGLDTMKFEQKCCSKLWNGAASSFKEETGNASPVGGSSTGGSSGGGIKESESNFGSGGGSGGGGGGGGSF